MQKTDQKCVGDINGTITVTVESGNTPFVFSKDSMTTAGISGTSPYQFTGLAPGRYVIAVGDKYDTVYQAITINPATQVVISKLDVTPYSSTTPGTITVTATGGTEPYNYSFTSKNSGTKDNGPDPKFTGLSVDSFFIKVTDKNLCNSTIDTAVVISDTVLLANVYFKNVECHDKGTSDTLKITVTNGVAPITYTLTMGPNTLTQINDGVFNELFPGTYSIYVFDKDGKRFRSTIAILDTMKSISITGQIQGPVCGGSSTGSIVLTVTGGAGNYSYAWYNEDDPLTTITTDKDLSNSAPGFYYVEVTDKLGCLPPAKKFEIAESKLEINKVDAVNSLCNIGLHNGSIKLSSIVGTYPIHFAWSHNSDLDTSFVENLAPGSYTVIATDKNNCSATISATIDAIDNFSVSLFADMVYCDSYGQIGITAEDGVANYKLTWNDEPEILLANVDTVFEKLLPGEYAVRVVDNNNCEFTDNISIELNDKLRIDPAATFVENENCIKEGSISISIPNTIADFSYNWSDFTDTIKGKDSRHISRDAMVGTYIFSMRNALGCSFKDTFEVVKADSLVLFATPDTTICRGEDFVLNAYAFAGKPLGASDNIMYRWGPNPRRYFTKESDSIISNPILKGNYNGIYRKKEVILTLNATYGSCKQTKEVYIAYYPSNGISLPAVDTVSKGDYIVIPLIGGTGVYSRYMWTPNVGIVYGSDTSRNMTVNIRKTHTYYFTGITFDGCIEQDSIQLVPAATIKPCDALTPNNDGFNDYWYIPNAQYYPGLLVEVFSRWGDKVFSMENYNNDDKVWNGSYNGKELPIGTYYYVITVKGEQPVTGTVTIMR